MIWLLLVFVALMVVGLLAEIAVYVGAALVVAGALYLLYRVERWAWTRDR